MIMNRLQARVSNHFRPDKGVVCWSVLLVLFSLLMTIPVISAGQTGDVDFVLERMIEAYGGRQNLRKLNNSVQKWDIRTLSSNKRGSDVRSILIPGRLKVELSYPDNTEMRVLNGESAHVVFSGKASRTASAPQRDAMRLQLMRMYSPLVLGTKRDALTLTLEDKWCGLALIENGIRVDYLVDMETWRIVNALGRMSFGGTEMQFLTKYSDFHFRDGVLVHEQESKHAGGVNTAVLKLRSMRFDAGLGDLDFTR